ncbi:Pycsar system effector family protein [Streptomyces sp. NPDC050204]|uniref:Pycsar system effector family protein n=1 Tax=Streptomyces sp. NPDC050204 TaxID=3155514 RepID=UPI00341E4B5D
MTTQTNHTQAAALRGLGLKALDGEHPRHDWPINNGPEVASAHASMAIATELADVTDRLIALDVDVARLADAAEERNRAAERVPDYTEAELLVVRGEISRTDTKSSILLASVAIVTGPLAEYADTVLRQPWPVAVLAGIAAALAGVAAWFLLDVVLPNVGAKKPTAPARPTNFIYYARCAEDPEGLDQALSPDVDRRGELVGLSSLAMKKFGLLRRAGVLLKLSGLLFAATAALAIAL